MSRLFSRFCPSCDCEASGKIEGETAVIGKSFVRTISPTARSPGVQSGATLNLVIRIWKATVTPSKCEPRSNSRNSSRAQREVRATAKPVGGAN